MTKAGAEGATCMVSVTVILRPFSCLGGVVTSLCWRQTQDADPGGQGRE